MQDQADPDWLDKTGFGVTGTFTLNGGEEVIAEIVDYSEDANELIVEPIATGETDRIGENTRRALDVNSVISFFPEPPSAHAWPHSDPCRTGGSSVSRFAIMTCLFLGSTVGSLVLFITLMNSEPYRLQELSTVSYTLAVGWLTFAAHRDAKRFLFSCPAVKSQFPTLLRRHVLFLLALFITQTAALSVQPGLPAWWSLQDSKGGTPFQVLLLFVCCGLAIAEVYSNRSILIRAHSDIGRF